MQNYYYEYQYAKKICQQSLLLAHAMYVKMQNQGFGL